MRKFPISQMQINNQNYNAQLLQSVTNVLMLTLPIIAVISRIIAPGWMLFIAIYTGVPVMLIILYIFTIRTIIKRRKVKPNDESIKADKWGIIGAVSLFLTIVIFPESDDQTQYIGFNIPFDLISENIRITYFLAIPVLFILGIIGYIKWFSYTPSSKPTETQTSPQTILHPKYR